MTHSTVVRANVGRSSGTVMSAERLPADRAVDAGGLVDVVGDALQADEHQQHVEAGVAPDDEEDRRPQRAVGGAEEGEAPRRHEVGERTGDRASRARRRAGMPRPGRARSGIRNDGAQEALPAGRLLHEQRQAEPEADQQDRRDDRVLEGEPDRSPRRGGCRRRRRSCRGSSSPWLPPSSGQSEADICSTSTSGTRKSDDDEERGRARRRAQPAQAACAGARVAGGARRRCGAARAVTVMSCLSSGVIRSSGRRCGWPRASGAPSGRRLLREDRGDLVVVGVDDVAVAEDRVAHQRQPRAARGVERLLEVQRDRRVALGRRPR